MLLGCPSGVKGAAARLALEQLPQRDLLTIAVGDLRSSQRESAVLRVFIDPDQGRALRGRSRLVRPWRIERDRQSNRRRDVFFRSAARDEKCPEGNGNFVDE